MTFLSLRRIFTRDIHPLVGEFSTHIPNNVGESPLIVVNPHSIVDIGLRMVNRAFLARKNSGHPRNPMQKRRGSKQRGLPPIWGSRTAVFIENLMISDDHSKNWIFGDTIFSQMDMLPVLVSSVGVYHVVEYGKYVCVTEKHQENPLENQHLSSLHRCQF